MANPIKGEVELKLSNGRKLVLIGDFQSRVEAEHVYGKPYLKIIEDAQQEYFGAIAALFYGMLKRRQPNATMDDVGRLFDEEGQSITDAIERAMEAAASKREDGDGPNPPKRQRGKNSGRNGAR